MGHLMTGRALCRFARKVEPTPLLAYLAGGFAANIANLWPAPHEGFFALTAERRHAVALLLRVNVPATQEEKQELIDRVMHMRGRDLAKLIVGATKGNFLSLLSKLGEVLWTTEDYAALLEMQARYEIAFKLRHMPDVTPLTMRLAAKLPDMFVRPKILAAVTTQHCADDVIETVQIIENGVSVDALKALASRMAKARSIAKTLDILGAELLPEIFKPLIAVPRLNGRFETVETRKQLKAVALAFKNCLRDYDHELASGENAVFVWKGDGVKVVLAIGRDPAGWILEEAKLAENKDLPPNVLMALVADLNAGGVRVGSGRAALKNRLHGHGCASCVAPTYAPYPNWRGALAKATAELEAE